jgi:phosphoribosylanthranilate isomerase
MSVDVKICGVCRAGDARVAAAAGARWLGVILAPGYSRTQTVDGARVIFEAAAIRRAGVFVDAEPDEVASAARALALDAVQLHGEESPAYVGALRGAVGCEVWKAIRVRDPRDLSAAAGPYAGHVDAVLLDGWSPDAHGGAGVSFDWSAAAAHVPAGVRLIVAGGLRPENVARAVSVLRPAMVDVSSGVEDVVGQKAPDRIHAFIAAARGAKDR